MTKLKFGLMVAFLTVVGLLSYSTYYFYQDSKQLSKEKGTLEEKVTGLQHDIELIRVGTAAMNLGQLLADKQKAVIDTASKTVRTELKAKEMEVDNSSLTADAKATAKSELRMDSVWKMYCVIQPDNAICNPVKKP